MRRFFRNLSFPVKLTIIGVVPLLFILYLTADLYEEKNKNIEIINAYVQKVDLVGALSKLSESLQKEQKLSYDFVTKKSGDRSPLKLQRQVTDSVLGILKSSDDKLLKGFEEFTSLHSINDVRKAIDSSKLPPNLLTHFYSNTIFRLSTLTTITFEDKSLLTKYDDEVQSQRLLGELLTYVGIIRFNIYQVLITRQYMVETLIGSIGAYDVANSIEQELKIKAPPDVLKAYNNLAEHSAYKPAMDYIRKLFGTFKFDSTYNAEQWWNVSEEGMKQLTALQVRIWKSADKQINETYKDEVAKKNIALILLLVMIAVVIAIISLSIVSISRMLSELKEGAEKIAKGQSITPFDMPSKDVIGSLATSISKIDENDKRLALAAGEIGDGNFDVPVTPRSDEDILANALNMMKANLQFYVDEIEEREFRFKQLADLIPQIVWTSDAATGKADYLNKQWYAYAGDVEFTSAIHPDDAEAVNNAWLKAVERGGDYSLELRLQNYYTKQYRWFLTRAIPIKDAEGKVTKWFGTSTDIHERKTMQEELQELVQLRTQELNRSNEDLQRFAHVASHDLKEPLRKIQIFSDRLVDELGDSVSEKSKSFLSKILVSSRRLMQMVEGILIYSTIDTGESRIENIDLNKVVQNIREDLEVVIEQKHASVRSIHLPVVEGVPVLFQQLFYNLINNALKFSKEDVAPVVELTAQIAVVASSDAAKYGGAHGRFMQVKIKDNGIGFNEQYAEQVFDVFSRLSASSKYEGTGLGLALCKKIMSRHSGFIYATSEEGVGSTFYLLFPLSIVKAEAAEAEEKHIT